MREEILSHSDQAPFLTPSFNQFREVRNLARIYGQKRLNFLGSLPKDLVAQTSSFLAENGQSLFFHIKDKNKKKEGKLEEKSNRRASLGGSEMSMSARTSNFLHDIAGGELSSPPLPVL